LLQETDPFKLEEKLGAGQLEEAIEQAEFELIAARALIESKAWEPLIEKPLENQWRWPIA
jgi:NADH dehydrogenase (ubiquinone) 1 alpha subcomplex subunit 5